MERLFKFRKLQGLSQEAMARKIGVTLSYYQKIEQGYAGAGAGFIKKFLQTFPETSADIFFREEKRA